MAAPRQASASEAPHAAVVASSKELASALGQPGVQEILILHDILLDANDWSSPVTLATNTTIRGTVGVPDPATKMPPMPQLNFGALRSRLFLLPNVTLALRNVVVLRIESDASVVPRFIGMSPGATVLLSGVLWRADIGLPVSIMVLNMRSYVRPEPPGGAQDVVLDSNPFCYLPLSSLPPVPAASSSAICPGVGGQAIFQDWVIQAPADMAMVGVNMTYGGYRLELVDTHYTVDVEVDSSCYLQRSAAECIQEIRAARSGSEGDGREEGQQGNQSIIGPVVLATVLPVCSLALLALAWRAWRAHKERRTLLGGVLPPGPGPLTTLLITDVASSTTLWEALPTEVMDEAMHLHHRLVRELLAKHSGYESAVEGDSFIVAFHTPADAARCATHLQSALLTLPWPAALLEHPDACELWVLPPDHRSLDESADTATAATPSYRYQPHSPRTPSGRPAAAGAAEGAQAEGQQQQQQRQRCGRKPGSASASNNSMRWHGGILSPLQGSWLLRERAKYSSRYGGTADPPAHPSVLLCDDAATPGATRAGHWLSQPPLPLLPSCCACGEPGSLPVSEDTPAGSGCEYEARQRTEPADNGGPSNWQSTSAWQVHTHTASEFIPKRDQTTLEHLPSTCSVHEDLPHSPRSRASHTRTCSAALTPTAAAVAAGNGGGTASQRCASRRSSNPFSSRRASTDRQLPLQLPEASAGLTLALSADQGSLEQPCTAAPEAALQLPPAAQDATHTQRPPAVSMHGSISMYSSSIKASACQGRRFHPLTSRRYSTGRQLPLELQDAVHGCNTPALQPLPALDAPGTPASWAAAPWLAKQGCSVHGGSPSSCRSAPLPLMSLMSTRHFSSRESQHALAGTVLLGAPRSGAAAHVRAPGSGLGTRLAGLMTGSGGGAYAQDPLPPPPPSAGVILGRVRPSHDMPSPQQHCSSGAAAGTDAGASAPCPGISPFAPHASVTWAPHLQEQHALRNAETMEGSCWLAEEVGEAEDEARGCQAPGCQAVWAPRGRAATSTGVLLERGCGYGGQQATPQRRLRSAAAAAVAEGTLVPVAQEEVQQLRLQHTAASDLGLRAPASAPVPVPELAILCDPSEAVVPAASAHTCEHPSQWQHAHCHPPQHQHEQLLVVPLQQGQGLCCRPEAGPRTAARILGEEGGYEEDAPHVTQLQSDLPAAAASSRPSRSSRPFDPKTPLLLPPCLVQPGLEAAYMAPLPSCPFPPLRRQASWGPTSSCSFLGYRRWLAAGILAGPYVAVAAAWADRSSAPLEAPWRMAERGSQQAAAAPAHIGGGCAHGGTALMVQGEASEPGGGAPATAAATDTSAACSGAHAASVCSASGALAQDQDPAAAAAAVDGINWQVQDPFVADLAIHHRESAPDWRRSQGSAHVPAAGPERCLGLRTPSMPTAPGASAHPRLTDHSGTMTPHSTVIGGPFAPLQCATRSAVGSAELQQQQQQQHTLQEDRSTARFGWGSRHSTSATWAEFCRQSCPPAPAGSRPGLLLLMRGLRVRCGLHCGLAAGAVCANAASGRRTYGGELHRVAHAVADAAAGGMVLVTDSVQAHLCDSLAALAFAAGREPPQLLFCGEAEDEEVLPSSSWEGPSSRTRALYQLLLPDLTPRIGYMEPLRKIGLAQLGNCCAPTGYVAIAFMYIMDSGPLMAELGAVARGALAQAKALSTRLLTGLGGYVVEAGEGLVLAAFCSPLAAVVWGVRARQLLNNHPWSAEMLDSQWCGEPCHAVMHTPATAAAMLRGPGSSGTPSADARPSTATGVRMSLDSLQHAHSRGGQPRPWSQDRRSSWAPPSAATAARAPQAKYGVLAPATRLRGPRTRTGITFGPAAASVSGVTGRMTYRGKVMNRAARIAMAAGDGEVFCCVDVLTRLLASVPSLANNSNCSAASATGHSALHTFATAASSGASAGVEARALRGWDCAAGVAAWSNAHVGTLFPGVALPEGWQLRLEYAGAYALKGVPEPADLLSCSAGEEGAAQPAA